MSHAWVNSKRARKGWDGEPSTMMLFGDMRQKRRAQTRTIKKAKILHSRQCLDEAGEVKLWKAAIYMRPPNSRGSSCPRSWRSTGDRQPREGAGVYCLFLVLGRPPKRSLSRWPWLNFHGSRFQRLKSIVSVSEICKRLDRAKTGFRC